MRVLIMILIIMDYVKKDKTFAGKQPQDCRECCTSFTCQNGGTCTEKGHSYTCNCPTGYDGKNCGKTKRTSTPPATSTHKTTTTIMSTPTEEESTAASTETATDTTYSTKKSSAPTTDVAAIKFNSSTAGSTRLFTPAIIVSSTTEADPSTRPEEATSSPFLEEDKKSAQVSVIAGSIGGIVLAVLLTIGLVIFVRTRRHLSDDTVTTYTKYNNDIDSNTTYDALGSPSADNVPTSFKDSGFGNPDESIETDIMDGEYNTLRLHFPVTNEMQDNTYNHNDGSLTANSTYSLIPYSKNALFDNTYSHMPNVTNGKSFEHEDKDATDNNLEYSCSSKRKGKTEESRDETYNHTQMNHVRPTADQEDQNDNYSQINLS